MTGRKRLNFLSSEKGLGTSSSKDDIGELSYVIAKGIIENMNDREMKEIYKLEQMMNDKFSIDKVVERVSNIVANAYGQSVAVETLNLIDENEEKASLNLAKELIGVARKAREQTLLNLMKRENLYFKNLSLDSTIIVKDTDTTNSKGDFKSQSSLTRNKRLSISRIPIKIPENIRQKLDNNEQKSDLDISGNRNSSITLKNLLASQSFQTRVQEKNLKNQISQESIEDTKCIKRNNASLLNSLHKKKEVAELEMKLPKRRLKVTKLHLDNDISKKCRMTEEGFQLFARNKSSIQKESHIPSIEFDTEEYQTGTSRYTASTTMSKKYQGTLLSCGNKRITHLHAATTDRRNKIENKGISNKVTSNLKKNFKKPMLPLKPVSRFFQNNMKITKNISKAMEDIHEIVTFKTPGSVVCSRCKNISRENTMEYSNYNIRCSGVASTNINLPREISLCQSLMNQMSKEEKNCHFKKAFHSLKLKLNNTQEENRGPLTSSQTSLSSGLFASKGSSEVDMKVNSLHQLRKGGMNGKRKNEDNSINALSFDNIKINRKTPQLETRKQTKRLTNSGLRSGKQPEKEEDRCGDDARSKESLEVNPSFSDDSMKTLTSKISLEEYTTNLQRESDSYFFQSYTHLPIENGVESTSSSSSLDGSIDQEEPPSFDSLDNQTFDWKKSSETPSINRTFDISEGLSPLKEFEATFFDASSSSMDPGMPDRQHEEKEENESSQRSSRKKLFWRNGNKLFVFLLIGMSSLAMFEGFRISVGNIRDYLLDFFHSSAIDYPAYLIWGRKKEIW